ncbi:dihydrodipicolinate synthase family protein [bacterium]|nr:dihydrodipicolinate synthase family protein [bacterium]
MPSDVSFKGVFPILVTPFDEEEDVDLDSFVRVVRFMAEIGVDGVTILGVLGESNRMVDSEREELIMAAVAATEVHMSVPLILRMVKEIPRIACIKQEVPPTPARIAALLSGMKDRRVPVLTGLGGLYGMFDLERGSSGYMTGFAFPEVLIAMVKAVGAGRMEDAWELYRRFLPLIVFEQQPGIAIRKEIYRLRGLLRSNRVRHPGAQLAASAGEQLRSVLARVLPGVDITRPLAL